MTAPKEINRLIERFQENRDVYCSSQYNEAQARIEFIDPLFKALGWDMTNEKGYAEAYKEVIHEDAIKVGGATKAPDYAFRIGGVRKFFVEAKRPGVNIKEDGNAAYQLRRYAWSAKLSLSIVTDFEEFAVYDSRIKPAKTDKPSLGRVLYLTLDQYDKHWDEIAQIFSQDAILTGSFDKYVQSAKKKRGTAEVDTAFLKEIEAWRDVLARNIALRNGELSTRELNYAVQRTIDRIIFLRICEDRGIEQYGQLMALENGTNIYKRLCQIFRRADERYNSGLFHFSIEKDRLDPPDNLTLNLTIDDKLIKGIIKGLYYPESPFEFSVLPADILGHIYEQFLGKVIRLTAAHHAKVEDKPQVKKAGGVYYTPTYIVDYIVKNTVGKLLEQNTPKQVSSLRVLDPACGSGSFLLGAYQTLLDWHQQWYTKHDPEKHAKGKNPRLYRTIDPSPSGRGQGEGAWRLTTAERKRILLNNIYGVDIDTQAVEVTKLSLLLKVLEGENAETLGKNLRLFHERALPDLGNNIKCGNSLIGPDFYEGKQISLLDEEERYRINAFDWNIEFHDIMAAAGFDAVIGNPPYGRDILTRYKAYFDASYRASQYKVDSFTLFIEKGLSLLRKGGRFAHIVPNTWLNTTSFTRLRGLLLEGYSIDEIVNLGKGVFRGVNIDTMLLFCSREECASVHVVDAANHSIGVHRLEEPIRSFTVDSSEWKTDPQMRFNVHANPEELHVIRKVFEDCIPLESVTECTQGLIPYNTKEMSRKNLYLSSERKGPDWKALLDKGSCVQRYYLQWNGIFVHFGPWLYTANSPRFYENPKILVQRHRNPALARRIVAAFDDESYYFKDTLCGLIESDSSYELKFILGILNSKLLNFVYKKMFTEVSLNPTYLKQLPLPRMDLISRKRRECHDELVTLVKEMKKLTEEEIRAGTDHDRKLLQRQIKETDKQIDQLVYELYGLTEEEIPIVEEATK